MAKADKQPTPRKPVNHVIEPPEHIYLLPSLYTQTINQAVQFGLERGLKYGRGRSRSIDPDFEAELRTALEVWCREERAAGCRPTYKTAVAQVRKLADNRPLPKDSTIAERIIAPVWKIFRK